MTTLLITIGAIWFGMNALLFIQLYFRPTEQRGICSQPMGMIDEEIRIAIAQYGADQSSVRG